MTKEQFEARFNEMIEDIIDADREWNNCKVKSSEKYRQHYKVARQKLMDAILDFYVG